MHATAEVSQLVETIAEATRHGTDASLRAGGVLMPPQVHLLVEQLEAPNVGYLSCRPFYRGPDVVDAMALMGVMGSVTEASRLLVVWEHQDLCVAQQLDGAGSEPNGHVVVDVVRSGGHVLRWQPFRMHLGPATSAGLPTVLPEWGAPVRHPGAGLPLPVVALLAAWREPKRWTRTERDSALAYIEQRGFRMQWLRRADGGQGAPVR